MWLVRGELCEVLIEGLEKVCNATLAGCRNRIY